MGAHISSRGGGEGQPSLERFPFDAVLFAGAFAFGFADDVFFAADFGFVLDDAALVDFADDDFGAVAVLEAEDFAVEAVERFRGADRLASSPIGRALPTALTAPLATSPTVPATLPAVLPAVRPTCFMILAASGIGRPPFVRPVAGRSSVRKCTLHAGRLRERRFTGRPGPIWLSR
jgi:hypothetical protein